jgi:hypothetical protein
MPATPNQPASSFLETSEIPAWLLSQFGPPGADGTWDGSSLADMIHDHGFKCEACAEVFGTAGELEDGCCEDCQTEFRLNGGRYTDMVREHGRVSL